MKAFHVIKVLLNFHRLDTTVLDFNGMHWERGDITFVFNGDAKPSQSLTVLDNKLHVFQRIRYEVRSMGNLWVFLDLLLLFCKGKQVQ